MVKKSLSCIVQIYRHLAELLIYSGIETILNKEKFGLYGRWSLKIKIVEENIFFYYFYFYLAAISI